MACISCRDGLHWECNRIYDGACCCSQANINYEEPPIAEEELDDDNPRIHSRTYKRDKTLKDQQSTGRKRAAVLYPLDREAPCEWLGLKYAGGGNYSIVGCNGGLQQSRHHGPDKNTLNNDQGNVHRICHKCHNRWHTRNDQNYVAGEIPKFHDPITKATIEEIAMSEVYWVTTKVKVAKD